MGTGTLLGKPDEMLGSDLAMDQHPSQGEWQYLQLHHAQENRISTGYKGPLTLVQTLTIFIFIWNKILQSNLRGSLWQLVERFIN